MCPFLKYNFLFMCRSYRAPNNPDLHNIREFCRTSKHVSCPYY